MDWLWWIIIVPSLPITTASGVYRFDTPTAVVTYGSTILPGDGWEGETAQPDAVGSGDGVDAKVMAHWDVVPHQTFTGVFKIGVVAFHINGINRVEFAADNGAWIAVAAMSENTRTGVWEYWVNLNAADCDDGAVELRAVAYPETGIPRVLETLTLYANDGGTLPTETLYVSTTGNDTTGDGSAETPYATIRKALDVCRLDLETYDGTTIVLQDEGTHSLPSNTGPSSRLAGYVNNDRWITIKAADGLTRENVNLGHTGGYEEYLYYPDTNYVKFEGVSFDWTSVRQIYKINLHDMWLHNCYQYASGGWDDEREGDVAGIREDRDGSGQLYVTNGYSYDTAYSMSGYFCRDCYVNKFTGDNTFGESAVVINCHVNNIDYRPLLEDVHADVMQYSGSTTFQWENVIVYGLLSSNTYGVQNMFWRGLTGTTFTNIAVVNACFINTYTGAELTQLYFPWDHALFMHISQDGQQFTFRDDSGGGDAFSASNVKLVNCMLYKAARGAFGAEGLPDGVSCVNCHFITGTEHGTNASGGTITITYDDESGWDYGGSDAGDIVETGYAMPGFRCRHWDDSGDPAPDKGAFEE
jgi:hypothetical protein